MKSEVVQVFDGFALITDRMCMSSGLRCSTAGVKETYTNGITSRNEIPINKGIAAELSDNNQNRAQNNAVDNQIKRSGPGGI